MDPREREFKSRKLAGVSLRNFRGFGDDEVEIPLGKMTLIFGPNSGGKSSILKALGSFPQSSSMTNSRVGGGTAEWNPAGAWFDLGSKSSVVHNGHLDEAQNGFSIGFIVEEEVMRVRELAIESLSVGRKAKLVFDIPEEFSSYGNERFSIGTRRHYHAFSGNQIGIKILLSATLNKK